MIISPGFFSFFLLVSLCVYALTEEKKKKSMNFKIVNYNPTVYNSIDKYIPTLLLLVPRFTNHIL